jgi:hypothetical protein
MWYKGRVFTEIPTAMELAEFLQYIWIPAVGMAWGRIEGIRKELAEMRESLHSEARDFHFRVAAEYTTKEEFYRMNAKLDNLADKIEKLLIEVAKK